MTIPELYSWGPPKLKSEQCLLKFSFSEKARKMCAIVLMVLKFIVNVKTMRTIAHIFVAFSEKLNFTKKNFASTDFMILLKLKRTFYRKLQTLKFLRMRAPLVCCLNTYLLSTYYTTQHSNHFANSKIRTYLIKSVNPRMKFWCLQISQKANQILDRFLPYEAMK